MLTTNLKSAFQLFQVAAASKHLQSDQQLLQHFPQLQLTGIQLPLSSQQVAIQSQPYATVAASLPTHVNTLGSLPHAQVELFNQNLFYQAVFSGKDLELHLDGIVKRREKLEGMVDFFAGFAMPNFIKLIGNITLASLQKSMDSSADIRIINELIENPLKIILKEQVFKLIFQVVAKRYFEFREQAAENYYKELAHMLLFKPDIADTLFSLLSTSNNSSAGQKPFQNSISLSITLGDIQTFYSMLIGSSQQEKEEAERKNNKDKLFASITFHQFGGAGSRIVKDVFVEKFTTLVSTFNGYFERQNTIVSFIKRNTQQKLKLHEDELLQSYLQVIGDFKQTNLKNFLQSLAAGIFEQQDSLDAATFVSRVLNIHRNTKSRIVFTLLDILQIELDLVHQLEFIEYFVKAPAAQQQPAYSDTFPSATGGTSQQSSPFENSNNYYLKTIDKLLNKCIFNGDEKCECKKCQCIRRNRTSAKESQKKKRDALQQIGPLLEKQEQLEKRLQELESENAILRKLLTEVVQKEGDRSSLQEIFQPISKIIAYSLKEEEGEGDQYDQYGAKPSKRHCPSHTVHMQSEQEIPHSLASNYSI